jgi:hypothetical protein
MIDYVCVNGSASKLPSSLFFVLLGKTCPFNLNCLEEDVFINCMKTFGQ